MSLENHCTGKDYQMNDETRYTEIHASIIQKALLVVEFFSCVANIAHVENDGNDVTWSLCFHLLLLMYWVG